VASAVSEMGSVAACVIRFSVDVTDQAQVEAALQSAASELGPVTLLVNNAGTLEAIGPTWELDPDVWRGDIESHLRGALLCARAVLPTMIARGEGRIVNVVGMLGQQGEPFVSAYVCAKAGLFRLTDCLAAELRDQPVRISASSQTGPLRRGGPGASLDFQCGRARTRPSGCDSGSVSTRRVRKLGQRADLGDFVVERAVCAGYSGAPNRRWFGSGYVLRPSLWCRLIRGASYLAPPTWLTRARVPEVVPKRKFVVL
jgi:NAD(P)-dependent dehydrogenase (short-subunit alcohol dehydrogenase family)